MARVTPVLQAEWHMDLERKVVINVSFPTFFLEKRVNSFLLGIYKMIKMKMRNTDIVVVITPSALYI